MTHALQVHLQRIEADPRDTRAWVAAARAMLAIGATTDALHALQAALRLEPTDPGLLNELGTLLARLDVRGAPEACYRKALREDPDNLEARTRLGRLRLGAGDLDEAGRCFVAILHRDPSHSAATAGIAEVLDRRGHSDEAWTFLQESRARPSIPLALATAGVARHVGRPTEGLAPLKRALRRARADDRSHLLHAEGDLHDAAGDHGRAWRAWTEANRSRKLSFSADAHGRAIDLILEATTELQVPPVAPGKPVFVVGMPRSGTTLLETLLDRHSGVHGAGELEAIQDIGRQLAAAHGGSYLLHLDQAPRWTSARDAYLAHVEARAPGALRVVDKMPHNALHLALIGSLMPEARILWVTRDRDDVALSCFGKRLSAGLPWATSLQGIRAFQSGLDRLHAHWIERGLPLLTVSYEALVRDPKPQLQRICAFIGVGFEPGMLDTGRRRTVSTHSWDQVNAPIHTGRIGRSAPYRRLLQSAAG